MSALGEGEASVLSRAIGAFSNRKPRLLDTDRLNGICFYTGSLGAGGAERQLTQMASAFHHRKRAGRNIHGTRLTGQIEVIVNNVDKDRGKNFFGPALKASGVALSVTSNMPCADLSEITPDTPHLSRILPMLPRNVRYGLERLTAHFRKTAPDVAYFWQDGAVLTGVLAALVAEVPRIAISLRGLPPNLRPNMMKPEYPDLYRSASCPTTVSKTITVVGRYSTKRPQVRVLHSGAYSGSIPTNALCFGSTMPRRFQIHTRIPVSSSWERARNWPKPKKRSVTSILTNASSSSATQNRPATGSPKWTPCACSAKTKDCPTF